MAKDYYVTEFQKSFPLMNKKLKDTDEKTYDYGILHLYTKEIERGFKAKRINKPNTSGTKVTYAAIQSEEEFEIYRAEIELMIKKFNEKYGENVTLGLN